MVGILNRVGMIISTTGQGTVTANTVISNRFNSPADAGAVNATQYYWLHEEDNDYELFIGTWTLSGTTVSRDTVLMSKIAGVKGTTKMTLAGNATLRSVTPAEALSGLFTAAGGSLTGALNWAAVATVASAATTDIGAAASNYVNITGTTAITGLGTVASGAMRWVKFAGALTLTYNATSMINIGAANITTAANDVAVFVSEGAGNWRMLAYARADGSPLLGFAIASDIWTGTNAAKPLTPKNAADSNAFVTLTSSTSISTDASTGYNFFITLAHNTTLANPTNLIDGRTYQWLFQQDGTGSRTGAFGTTFEFTTTPTFSTTAGKRDLIVATYHAASGKLIASFRKGS